MCEYRPLVSTEHIFCNDQKYDAKIPLAFCQGNQRDANFLVVLQKDCSLSRNPDEEEEVNVSKLSSRSFVHISFSSTHSQRLPAESRGNDGSEAVSLPAQGLVSETAGKTVPSNWGQDQVKLQGHRAQTLPDDAERGGEEEAQGADSL